MLQAYILEFYQKERFWHRCLHLSFPKFFKISFFEENLRASAFEKQLPKLTEKMFWKYY